MRASARQAQAAAGQTLITLRQAGVRFGLLQALHGIDLTLQRGDRLVLVGANGSGKTTPLRLLHGLHGASGSGTAQGERIAHALQPDGRGFRAAMVFQRPFLLNLSVRLNVNVGLWLMGVPAAERPGRCCHPHVKAALAQQFADWVVSPPGQAAIAAYKVGNQSLFFADARR